MKHFIPDRIILVPDVHSSTNWRRIINKRQPGDEVIFLGDYFDRRGGGPFVPETRNFAEICAYAEDVPHTTLLAGNHDLAWLLFGSMNRHLVTSSWQLSHIKRCIRQLKIVKVQRTSRMPIIFSHAGVTATFMRIWNIADPEEINTLWLKDPETLGWIERNPENGQYSRPDGDDIWQSPLWTRFNSLVEDALPGYNQAVGHTCVSMPEIFTTRNNTQILASCTLDDQFITIPNDWI